MSRPAKAANASSNVRDHCVSQSSPPSSSLLTLIQPNTSKAAKVSNEKKREVGDEVLINVIDLEATCFKPWAGETQDIIEIGISIVNLTNNSIATTDSILVKPTHSIITPFCTSLTTITADEVAKEGISFEQAVRVLEDKYHISARLFASYGSFDIKLLKRQLHREGVSVNLPVSFVNVKKLVAVSYKRKQGCGMMKALTLCKLKHEGVHHRGDDDSRNISNILLHLSSRQGKDEIIRKNTEKVADIY